MRIAIAGCSGTGKTTLARAISEKYSLPLNPVGARSVALEMGFDNPYDVDKAGKRVEFQKRLFESKRAWELAHDLFVTDRTYLDNHLEEDAMEVFAGSMDRYDIVLWLPRHVMQDLGDGIRKTNSGYHRLYEFLLGHYLRYAADNGMTAVTRMLGGPLAQRQERAFAVIAELCDP